MQCSGSQDDWPCLNDDVAQNYFNLMDRFGNIVEKSETRLQSLVDFRSIRAIKASAMNEKTVIKWSLWMVIWGRA